MLIIMGWVRVILANITQGLSRILVKFCKSPPLLMMILAELQGQMEDYVSSFDTSCK